MNETVVRSIVPNVCWLLFHFHLMDRVAIAALRVRIICEGYSQYLDFRTGSSITIHITITLRMECLYFLQTVVVRKTTR